MKKIFALITAVLYISTIISVIMPITASADEPATVEADPYWDGTPSWRNATIRLESSTSSNGKLQFTHVITNVGEGYSLRWNPTTRTVGQINDTQNSYTTPESLVVPSVVDGTPVEIVGYRLFGMQNTNAKYIVVSEGIQSFAPNAQFMQYKELLGVKLPSTLTTTGTNTFDGCTKLPSIELPEGLHTIGHTNFKDCNALTSITIPASLGALKAQSFYNSANLETVIFRGVTNVEGSGTSTTGSVAAAFTLTPKLKNIIFLANTAPTGTLTGFKEAGANGAVTVYYPAGGTGFDVSVFRNAFRTGTVFKEISSVMTGMPKIGEELTGSFIPGQQVEYYWQKSESGDFTSDGVIMGTKTALPDAGTASYAVSEDDFNCYIRFCVEAFGQTYTSDAVQVGGGGLKVELNTTGPVNGNKFDITNGIGSYGATAVVSNFSDKEENVWLVSAWYKNDQLIDVRLNEFSIDLGEKDIPFSGDTIQPGNLDGVELKVFAFSNLKGLIPIASTKSVAGIYEAPPAPVPSDGGLYTEAQYAFVKAKIDNEEQPWLGAYNRLIQDAEAWINEEPSAVEIFTVPNYYESGDGGAGHRAASKNIIYDLKSAYACGLAYKFTGLSKYADQSVRILDNWAAVTKSINKGNDAPLVSGTIGGGFAMSAELIKDYNGWTNKAAFDTWLKDVFLTFPVTSQGNNWGDWTRFARLTVKAYLDMDITSEAEGFKESINAQDITAAGDLPNETWREANGMWYTYFALVAKAASAQIIYNTTGENVFYYTSPDGRNLKMAFDRFLTFCENRGGQGSGSVIPWPYNGGVVNYANPVQSYSWPFPLYEAMAGIYNEQRYSNFTQALRPLYGPFNSGEYHHIAFFYPTLMFNSVVIAQ